MNSKELYDHEGEMGNGRWHVQCFGRVMEPKKSFRTSSALSHACHTTGSAVSDPMYVWLSTARYTGISHSPMSVKDNTHHSQKYTRVDTLVHVASWKREWRCSSHVEPSNLSPPDKHPLDTVTFSPTQAECEGCKYARLCVHVLLHVFMCARYLCMQE